ncbi:MAG: DMT family transporter, partial [Gammaproteobacteria bacterium]|nr:DMT family transporter [Gammaproteobacteria bacterium]
AANPLANKNDIGAGVALFSYYALTTAAFSLANMVSVSLLVATTPAFVMGAEWMRGKRPARASMLGALLAFAGVVVLLAPAGFSPATAAAGREYFGQLLALASALSMTAFSLFGRAPDAHAAGASLWACLIGAAVLLLVAIAGGVPLAVAMPDTNQWLSLLGLAVFSTLAAAACYGNACRLCGATTAAVVRLSTPLFAALFLVAVFGGELSTRHFIAGALILLGASVVIMRRA